MLVENIDDLNFSRKSNSEIVLLFNDLFRVTKYNVFKCLSSKNQSIYILKITLYFHHDKTQQVLTMFIWLGTIIMFQ